MLPYLAGKYIGMPQNLPNYAFFPPLSKPRFNEQAKRIEQMTKNSRWMKWVLKEAAKAASAEKKPHRHWRAKTATPALSAPQGH